MSTLGPVPVDTPNDDTARRIAELLEASGPKGELILTSVEEFEAATGRSDAAIRAGLEVLTRDEAVTIRLPNGALADTERLPSWAAILVELHPGNVARNSSAEH